MSSCLATVSLPRASHRLCCYLRWANAARGHDEVVVLGHAPRSLNYFVLIVSDDLNTLECNAQIEAELGEIGRVGVDGLHSVNSTALSGCPA